MSAAVLTKIIATVGPASSDPEELERLVEAGASIFRLNFSHGTPQEHAARVSAIRAVAGVLDRPVAILGDVPGAKVRVGPVEGGALEVRAGDTLVLRPPPLVGVRTQSGAVLSCNCEQVFSDVEEGQRLLINDGLVRTLVVARSQGELQCAVTAGGTISTGKGINLPDTTLSLSALTERDWQWAAWALEQGVDFLGLSFVREAQDIERLKGFLEEAAGGGDSAPTPPSIVAKIEHPRAVENIEALTDAADAIMVARGDLGVEMDVACVPVVQRRLIEVAHEFGKPCIVATQMLESMIQNAQPTRAEVSDVAHAIFEEADAVMLSGETAVGRHPELAVQTMRRVAEEAEAYLAGQPGRSSPPRKLLEERHWAAAIAHGVWNVARDANARCVVVWSQSGTTARLLSQNNFRIPIVAVSSQAQVLRRMQLLRGVIPLRLDIPRDLADFTQQADRFILTRGLAAAGDACVLAAGTPIGAEGTTSTLSIRRVGE